MRKVLFTISISPSEKGQLCEVIRNGAKPSRAMFVAQTKTDALMRAFSFLNEIYEDKEEVLLK